jgi:hypothetical protein
MQVQRQLLLAAGTAGISSGGSVRGSAGAHHHRLSLPPPPLSQSPAGGGSPVGLGVDSVPSPLGGAAEPLLHPCMHLGYSAGYRRLHDFGVAPHQVEVVLQGAPDEAACSSLATELIRGMEDPLCAKQPCSPHLPTLEPVSGQQLAQCVAEREER